MQIGAAMFFTDYSITAPVLARALEERGFESLWAPEHSHIPVDTKSSFPLWDAIPKKYYDVMDPFVSLTAAAVATETLKLGTGICLVQQRDPIQTAKLVASIDQVSGGRFLFGVGTGWNAEEMADHGTVFETRNKLARERIEAMKEMWTQSKAEYHGDMVDFPPMMMWPKPVQKPYPPVIVGGAWPYAARRAVRYGDGWIPHAALPPHDDVTDFIPEFHKMARDAGRDPAELPVTVWGAQPDLDQFKQRRDRGAARVVISLESEPEAEILRQLDMWAEIKAKLN
ncbi:MAG: LLM class F420-dependent oxidoreductase [Rhodospirillaceae bacterium]|nr:LLM class F420-dependent oxidoreductase [Rhodospirillaceae bacterium]MDD9928751.1 LLM class F420-dependent oxidoreductase [Rhodospirillaceae bacterium]